MATKEEVAKDEAVAEVKQDGQNRVARTAGQTGVAGSVVVVFAWIMRLCGVDLNPDAGVEMPVEIVAALTMILTTSASALHNLSKLRGKV